MDEYDIIHLITSRFGKLPKGYSPIGDDVALVPATGEKVVLKSDMLVAKTDVPPGMTWRMAARKALAMCVSDFGAKGVRPTAFMVSLGLPKGVKEGQVAEIASGLLEGSKEWGVRLVGGDTGEADDLIVSCMMVGFAKKIVARTGARPGELVVTTGKFGKTAAGLKILMDGAKADPSFRKEAVASVCNPGPPLEVGLALSSYLTSSIDSSDGLAISLHTLAEMSKVGIKLTTIPSSGGIEKFALQNSYSAAELVLYGGEEYELVGTIPKSRIRAAKNKARAAGGELLVIGETVPAGRGVTFSNGKKVRRDGWVHFTNLR